MTLLPDNDQEYWFWRQFVVTHNVRGVQVHDARLAALMEVYGVTHILTLNQLDFARYSKLQVIHPSEIRP
jgi:predicted nucleic acid-binding protein